MPFLPPTLPEGFKKPIDFHEAIAKAVAETADPLVPAGKRFILVAGLNAANGAQATLAERVGEHWQFAQHVEWHGPDHGVDISAKVIASWD